MKVIFLILLFPAISCQSYGTKDGADVKCKTPGEVLGDPYDCSIYYVCDLNMFPQQIHCPSGQYFNPDTTQCADSSTVQCGEIRCTTPGQLIPDPVDCTKFYVCDLNLNAFQEQCPNGLVFDPADDVCDTPANVQGHCGGATTITTASTTSGPTAPPGIQCTSPGEMIPDPYDCQVFYICDADLKPLYRHCGGDLEFNPAIGNCDLPENVDCPGEVTTTSGPTAPPGIQCTSPGEMIPDPYDCQVFYICDADLKPLYRHCGGDLVFNPAIGNCDLPENVICPGDVTTTSVPTAPPGIQCTSPGEMIPDPYDCQVFYICDADLKPLYRHCGGDLEFNPAIGNCDLPENVVCPGDVLAEKPDLNEPIQVQCSFIGQMIPHPYDCGTYYLCDLNLVPQSNQCCCELKYNRHTETCDFAQDVVCPGEMQPANGEY